MADQTETHRANLGSVFDAHVKHEFVDHDVDATMQTMVQEPYLLHVPTLTGGAGGSDVRRFYERHFVGKWPADTTVSQISRTAGANQVVDELVLRFTHDVSLGFMLPGVPATGKQRATRRRGDEIRERQDRAPTHLLGSSFAACPSRSVGP